MTLPSSTKHSVSHLAGLLHILTANLLATAQQTSSDPRVDRLPVSVSFPVVLAWADEARNLVVGLSGVTLSTRISAPMTTGVTLRSWRGYDGPESCPFKRDACRLARETTALALVAHLEFYPSRNRLVFLRGGAGVSWLREQVALDSLIHESRSWPLTLLATVGWDFRLTEHVFATPLLEVIRTAGRERAPRTGAGWIVQAGAALTVR